MVLHAFAILASARGLCLARRLYSNFIGHISYDETSALIEGFRTLILRIGRSRRLYKKCKTNEKLCNLEVLKQGDSLQLEV